NAMGPTRPGDGRGGVVPNLAAPPALPCNSPGIDAGRGCRMRPSDFGRPTSAMWTETTVIATAPLCRSPRRRGAERNGRPQLRSTLSASLIAGFAGQGSVPHAPDLGEDGLENVRSVRKTSHKLRSAVVDADAFPQRDRRRTR